jgi:hypothetical protein
MIDESGTNPPCQGGCQKDLANLTAAMNRMNDNLASLVNATNLTGRIAEAHQTRLIEIEAMVRSFYDRISGLSPMELMKGLMSRGH